MFLLSCNQENSQNAETPITYSNFRELALETGWLPSVEFQDGAIKEDFEKYGDQHFLISRGYTELGACAGGGAPLCDFYFRNVDNQYIRVITSGEYYDSMKEFDAEVIYVRRFPDKQALEQDLAKKYYWSAVAGEEYDKAFDEMKKFLEENP